LIINYKLGEFMPEKKVEYLYKFVIALAPPDNQGVAEASYKLDKEQYDKVRNQIISKSEKILFIHEDGEPIYFTIAYPVIYVKTEKMKMPSGLILPDGRLKSVN